LKSVHHRWEASDEIGLSLDRSIRWPGQKSALLGGRLPPALV